MEVDRGSLLHHDGGRVLPPGSTPESKLSLMYFSCGLKKTYLGSPPFATLGAP